MSITALQFKQFLITSNSEIDPATGKNKTVDLRSGTPRFEYRESVFLPYIEITAYGVDTGNTLPADDGTGAGVGLLDSGFGQGTETVQFSIEDAKGNRINLSRDTDLRVGAWSNDHQGFKSNSYKITIVSKEAFDNTLLKNRCGGGEEKTDMKYSGEYRILQEQL